VPLPARPDINAGVAAGSEAKNRARILLELTGQASGPRPPKRSGALRWSIEESQRHDGALASSRDPVSGLEDRARLGKVFL